MRAGGTILTRLYSVIYDAPARHLENVTTADGQPAALMSQPEQRLHFLIAKDMAQVERWAKGQGIRDFQVQEQNPVTVLADMPAGIHADDFDAGRN